MSDVPTNATVAFSRDATGSPTITIAGELDISNVHLIEAAFESELPATSKVSFELSDVTFMDSSGIAMLLRAADRADTVVLRQPSDVIRRIIRATGLTEIFEIVDD